MQSERVLCVSRHFLLIDKTKNRIYSVPRSLVTCPSKFCQRLYRLFENIVVTALNHPSLSYKTEVISFSALLFSYMIFSVINSLFLKLILTGSTENGLSERTIIHTSYTRRKETWKCFLCVRDLCPAVSPSISPLLTENLVVNKSMTNYICILLKGKYGTVKIV